MKTIIISTSKFGNPVTDYFKKLGDCFIKNGYRVVFIFDGLFDNYPKETENLKYYTWQNKRPIKISDFIFFYTILKREKPILCISNFGSTNAVSIVSFLFRVKNRVNYIHTTSVQLSTDSQRSFFKNKFLQYRKKWIYSLNTHLFTNSEGNKEDSSSYYQISKKKITVFPLLIKKSKLKYKHFQERENCITIVGRLHPSKGHRELLYLFKECIKERANLKLKIIGDGFLKQDLIALAKDLNITENVIFLGNIPNEKMSEIFSSSLIGISSSIDEAYGLVNIESLREGTPIVCTKTAGSIDIVKVGYNGLFIKLDNKTSLSNSINKILNNWNSYSENALNLFKEEYDINNIEKHFKKIKYVK
jgi:glycosyltransferase involved in cell wall biosynthesis|tara:strand:- start:3143 stop:4225 length:1083 start_codon:yes stop_codon:yes gene_type:complete